MTLLSGEFANHAGDHRRVETTAQIKTDRHVSLQPVTNRAREEIAQLIDVITLRPRFRQLIQLRIIEIPVFAHPYIASIDYQQVSAVETHDVFENRLRTHQTRERENLVEAGEIHFCLH